MQQLRGTEAHYPWGTFDAIHALLGSEPDGRPLAEYWLGAHPSSPSLLGGAPLDGVLAARTDWLGDESVAAFGPHLPFLMKVLSARHALSLQTHPSREQAEQGYAAEEAAGVPLDSPQRCYKDTWPKPEILLALDSFHSLAGFRHPARTAELFAALDAGPDVARLVAPLTSRAGVAGLQEVFLDVLAMDESRRFVVDAVLSAALPLREEPGALGDFARTALELDETFPGDPGIIAALLLNRVTLAPGEALYVDAGVMHAHLRGTGIEVMASSDNVLRGGLTSKHIAVDELVRVVDFTPSEPEVLRGNEVGPGVFRYPTYCDEFDVWRLEVTDGTPLAVPAPEGARIALVVSGEVTLDDGTDLLVLERGDAAFMSADSAPVTARGVGQLFLAAPGLSA